jgi:CHAT domain-containing protein
MIDRTAERPALTLRAVQAKLPTGAVAVSYLVCDRFTAIWAIRRDRWRIAVIPVGEPAIGAAVSRYLERLREGGTADPEGRRLAALLLDPVRSEYADASEIVIIPDDALRNAAFAALRDWDGSYLVEKHVLLYSPSVTESVDSASAPAARRLLVISDPALSPTLREKLPPLNGARIEADRVRASYAQVETFVGAEATRKALLEHMDDADVLHYAGHAAVDQRRPPLSALFLASDGRDDGTLYAYEIASRRLRRLRLAVLAGCGTAATSRPTHDGISSVAHAFLRAGVRDVVASIWDVDDSTSGELLERFHRAYPQRGAAGALRAAQLECLHSENAAMRPPRIWAGFHVIGHL